MTLPEKHSLETKRLVKRIPKNAVAKWLLEEGYYPEQYVVPPTFRIKKFDLQPTPYFAIDTTGTHQKFEPDKFDLITVSFPKTQLTDRILGIIEPQIYHDIVWHLINDWDLILKKLFRPNNNIHSYSFPIPISSQHVGLIGHLRSGRMIYEFLEMAESDLVAEAYNYNFILRTDIKNFYPSIYTHSIAWAIHTKAEIRKKGNRNKFDRYVGLILDKLFQYSNDGCTNGIAIGPAVCDLVAEILLSEIDSESSKVLKDLNIDFLGVRFKDDYRFLCHKKEDANIIVKVLQKQLAKFNLTLNEKKCEIEELPEGLFREWTAAYQPYSLRYKKKISFKRFENSIRGTLQVDKKHEGTGVVNRFLSELYTQNYKLKFDFEEKELFKTVSLLLMLKQRRNKSFPQILGIIEQIILNNSGNPKTLSKINTVLQTLLNEKLKNIEDNQYDLLWLIYLIKSQNLFTISLPRKISSELIKCLRDNRAELFKHVIPDIKLFDTIKRPGKNVILLEHLALFKKADE